MFTKILKRSNNIPKTLKKCVIRNAILSPIIVVTFLKKYSIGADIFPPWTGVPITRESKPRLILIIQCNQISMWYYLRITVNWNPYFSYLEKLIARYAASPAEYPTFSISRYPQSRMAETWRSIRKASQIPEASEPQTMYRRTVGWPGWYPPRW